MKVHGSAVVTGANRGIGRALAIELANRGFDVIAAMRDPEPHRSLSTATSGNLRVERLDLTDRDSIRVPDDVRVVVNNAAVEGPHNPVELSTDAAWREVFETNVFGPVELTRRAIPVIRNNGGGVICNLTSSALLAPAPLYSAYRASKAAISALSESMRVELAPFGIRVIEILPGPIDTEMFRNSGPGRAALESEVYGQLAVFAAGLKEGVVPMVRTPEDAAAAIADVVLDDAAPLRNGCDPVSTAMLDGWRSTTDEDRITGMNEAFAAFRAEHVGLTTNRSFE